MATFEALRNVVIQQVPVLQTLRCYVGVTDDIQTEWVLTDLGVFTQHSDREKVRRHVMNYLDVAYQMHADVWPGQQVPRRRVPKRDGKKVAQRVSTEDVDGLLDHSTVPTTVLLCLVLILATSVRRSEEDRRTTLQGMRVLVDSIAQTCISWGDGNLQIDTLGFLVGDPWPASIRIKVQQIWDLDLMNSGRFWVQSAFEKPHIVDVMGFILRHVPRKPRSEYNAWATDLLPALKPLLHGLIRILADAVHQNILSLSISQGVKRKATAEQGKVQGAKRKKDVRTPLERAQDVADIVDKLYAREVAGLHACMSFLLLLISNF